jgi:hypothetical protein
MRRDGQHKRVNALMNTHLVGFARLACDHIGMRRIDQRQVRKAIGSIHSQCFARARQCTGAVIAELSGRSELNNRVRAIHADGSVVRQ